ncbi:MAG: hypothetical protein EZS28_010577, partial [Streblomastix strix]
QLSSDSIIDSLDDLHKVHGVPFEVCISSQMLRVIKTSFGVQKIFPDENPDFFSTKITIYKLKEKMIQNSHSKCIERLRVFYNKKGTLILDAGMMSHIHAVQLCLVRPLISPEPTFLSIYTGPCTADGFSRLVAQTTQDLQQFKIGLKQATTDGGSSFISALSPFSKQNYSRFLPKRLSKLIQNRYDDHLFERAQKNAIDMHYDICVMVTILDEDISSLRSQSNSKQLDIYLKSYCKTRRIGKFLAAEQVMDHSEEIIQLRSITIFCYEPQLSFIKTLCMNIFFYFFSDDYTDLFAYAFAFSTPFHNQIIISKSGINSPTATFLTNTIDDLEQEQEVQLIHQTLNDEELMLSQYFANEAVLFWAGKYGDMDDQKIIDNQIGYWQGQNKSNPMIQIFVDFTDSVLAFPSSDAGIERKFSQAKRFMGIGGQRVSLQTLFCELV